MLGEHLRSRPDGETTLGRRRSAAVGTHTTNATNVAKLDQHGTFQQGRF